MNKVMGIIALLALTGNIASAELLKNFKYDGDITVNMYNTNNADFNKNAGDKTGFTDTRVMLNMGFDLNEDVSAVVSAVKNNRQYGDASENAVNTALDSFVFEQAYINVKGLFGVDNQKLGRQYYGNAGDLVVYYGPEMAPYLPTLPVTGIDGWTGWHKYGNWDFHAIIANENKGSGAGNKNVNVYGFDAKTSVKDVNLNGYVYQRNDRNNAALKSDYRDLLGIRANYAIPQVKNLVVAAEYDMNMGRYTDPAAFTGTKDNYKHSGYAYKVNADYSMDLAGKLAFAAEYVFMSGDKKDNSKDEAFRAINSDYRPGLIMGGNHVRTTYQPVATDGMVTYNLGANWTPSKLEKLNVAAKYYDFSADNTNRYTKKHIGSELDAVLTWTHSANVSVNGYYAMFMPEKKNVATDDAETLMGAALNVKF